MPDDIKQKEMDSKQDSKTEEKKDNNRPSIDPNTYQPNTYKAYTPPYLDGKTLPAYVAPSDPTYSYLY
jgi:hypothetical protein